MSEVGERDAQPGEHRLAPLLRPRSIALVGASARAGSVAQMMVQTLLDSGYRGRIDLVNPGYTQIAGRPCVASLDELDQAPALVVAGVGSARLEAVVEQAIARGARALTIFDNCLGSAADGRTLIGALRERAAATGMPVCGGNGMGYYDIPGRCHVSFYPAAHLKPGGITLIAHSGSVFTVLALNDPRYRFDLVISAGQEIGARLDEYIDYALQRESTRVIALFMETARAPGALCAALEKAAARQVPVVICKVGRTEESARMAHTHSGALAGNDAAYQAAFERYGAIRVATVDQLMNTALLLSQGRRAGNGGLALVTDSGGLREALADRAAELDVPLARFGAATRDRLAAVLPATSTPSNPLDCAGPIDDSFAAAFGHSLAILAQAPEVSALGFEFDARDDYVYAPALQSLAEGLAGATDKPCFFYSSFAAANNRALADRLAGFGVPALNGLDEMLGAARALLQWRPDDGQADPAPAVPALAAWRGRLGAGATLAEADGLRLLREAGLPTVAFAEVSDSGALCAAARQLGYPLALKTAAPGIAHKSDAQGVYLGLADETALLDAYAALAARLGPAAIVQRMAEPGLELAFGCVHDPDFGPLVMVAAGGILIESLGDRVFALAPFGVRRARALLARLALWPLLNGARGRAPCDLDALCRALARFSALCHALGDSAAEIDVNPLLADARGVCAVDALLVGSGRAPGSAG